MYSTGDDGDLSVCFDWQTKTEILAWKQHTIQDVHAAQLKVLSGLSNLDQEEMKIAVIDAWNMYAFTKFVPYDHVETYVPPTLEHPTDVLEGGYTRAERHLLIGVGLCLDPLLEITKVYIDSMRFIGFSRQFKPLHSKSNLQVLNFVQHLRQTEDPNEVVEDEDENAEEIDPSDRQIVFVRRFSEAEEKYLRSKCCYPRQLKLADNYW